MRYIVPEIRGISSTDWDERDGRKTDFQSIPFHVEIGDINHDGADLFMLEVLDKRTTSDINYAEKNEHDEGWCSDRAKLLISDISLEKISRHIQDKIDKLGPYQSWPVFAERMSPYLVWEFEGVPYPPNM